jgi:hypothetical protein
MAIYYVLDFLTRLRPGLTLNYYGKRTGSSSSTSYSLSQPSPPTLSLHVLVLSSPLPPLPFISQPMPFPLLQYTPLAPLPSPFPLSPFPSLFVAWAKFPELQPAIKQPQTSARKSIVIMMIYSGIRIVIVAYSCKPKCSILCPVALAFDLWSLGSPASAHLYGPVQ